MKHDIIVVGYADETLGYRLAGVKKTYTPETEALLEKLTEGRNLIFMTQKAKKELAGEIGEISKKSIVQEIPAWNQPYTSVEDIIKDTVGLDLRK